MCFSDIINYLQEFRRVVDVQHIIVEENLSKSSAQ